jgi:hypothetical protein
MQNGILSYVNQVDIDIFLFRQKGKGLHRVEAQVQGSLDANPEKLRSGAGFFGPARLQGLWAT